MESNKLTMSSKFRKVLEDKSKADALEEVTDIKQAHQIGLRSLVADYYKNVEEGKAEGIRNAKELIEVMKMDLLLNGEEVEETVVSQAEEVRIQQINNILDLSDPNVLSIIGNIQDTINKANDDMDVLAKKKQ